MGLAIDGSLASDSSAAGPGGAGLGTAAEMVRRIRAGDREAEAELVEHFRRGLSLLLRRLTRDPALAEDLLQDTLALTLQKIRQGEVREPDRLAGFVRSLARNLWIADRRKEARYVGLDLDEGDNDRPARQLPDPGPAPSDLALAKEEARQVERLLSELRFDRDRELLRRFYLSEQSREEICEDLDLAPERFNQLIFRARERLRELWERAEKRRRFFGRVGRFLGRNQDDPSQGLKKGSG